jgi:hypothetical protein
MPLKASLIDLVINLVEVSNKFAYPGGEAFLCALVPLRVNWQETGPVKGKKDLLGNKHQ